MKKKILFIAFLSINGLLFSQPANDSCSNAETIALSTISQTINFSINDAQVNNEIGCEGTAPANYADVWYEFTMPVNGNIIINGEINWNRFAIYDTCGGTEISCFQNSRVVDGLVGGDTYQLRVFRTQALASNTSYQSFTIQAFEAVPNDDCANATSINVETANPLTVNFEITGAEINDEVGCEGTATADYLDVWYEFTMPVNGNININGAINWNRFAVYDACGGTEISCFLNSSIVEGLVGGNTYQLRVFRTLANALNLSFQSFSIQAFEVVPNDDCINAENIQVDSDLQTVNFSITGAEINNQEGCEGTAPANYSDVWYEFEMPFSGDLYINGTIVWNQFALYDSCGGNELHCSSTNAFIQGLDEGETYYLRVFRTEAQASNPGYQSFMIQAFENPTNCSSISIWDGAEWSNGLPDGTTKAVINDDFEITTELEWCELEIVNGTLKIVQDGQLTINETENNITINEDGELEVEGILNVQGSIDNEGILVFLSNETSTGQLGALSPGATITGNVEVHRYIPARRAFRFLSSSVTTSSSINANWQEGVNNPDTSTPLNPNPGFGTHITGSVTGENGFDATVSGNYSLFTLNNLSQSWEAVTNTDVNAISAGTAYRLMVRGDRSIDLNNNGASPTNTVLRSSGNLHVGSFTTTGFSNVAGAFNFFGNPYQAVVDMNQVLGASQNVNPAYYYVWDPQMGTRGAYVTIDLPGGTNSSTSFANQYLQPGQAVFVTTLNNGPSSLTFQESHKAVDQPLTQVFSINSTIDIRLYTAPAFAQGENATDALRIKFDEFGSNTVNEYDAPKFYNLDENLARNHNEALLSIESRAFPGEEEETLPLFVNQYRTTDYVFEARLTEMNGITVQLIDYFLNAVTTLQENVNTTYAFQVDTAIPESTASDRFGLVLKSGALHTETPAFNNAIRLYPNPVNEQFTIQTKNMASDEVEIKITCMSGRKVLGRKKVVDLNGQIKMNMPQVKSGVYLVELIHSQKGRYTTKLLKK